MAGNDIYWRVDFSRRDEVGKPLIKTSGVDRLFGDDRTRWQNLFEQIWGFEHELFELHIALLGTTISISGSVASEAVKTAIQSLVAVYTTRGTIENEIVVTAPFTPADRSDGFEHDLDGVIENMCVDVPDTNTSDDLGGVSPPPPSTEQTVHRYPSIRCQNKPNIRDLLFFEVGLDLQRDLETKGDPVALHDVPENWKYLDVDVEVHSAELDFHGESARGKIRVIRDGNSVSARFCAFVTEEANRSGGVEILALFSFQGRASGDARRSFKLFETKSIDSAHDNYQSDTHDNNGAVQFELSAQAPDLTIKIYKSGKEGKFLWSLEAAPRWHGIGGTRRSATIDLGDETRDYARNLLEVCPALEPGAHQNELRGIGERIWRATPQCFKDLYQGLCEKLPQGFAIQIITEEPHVPWEMMHPEASEDQPTPDYLFMAHPVSRWFSQQEGRRRTTFTDGSILSFVPIYPFNQSLPAAVAEGKWLAEEFEAISIEATRENFRKVLETPPEGVIVNLLHFAGHGSCKEANGASRLQLMDGWISSNELHSGVKLGERDHSFVVINACETAGSEYELGCIDGWPAALSERQFGGILAPLWAVQDENASLVVRDFVRGFRGRKTVGESIRTARVAHRAVSATSFAYICYGDVMARICNQ